MSTPRKVRSSLRKAIQDAEAWFYVTATDLPRDSFEKRGGDKGTKKVVYVCCGAEGRALYVGESSLKLKDRARVKTSRHLDAPWWRRWRTVRYLRIDDKTDRLMLEIFLILAMKPAYNSKPGPRDLKQMFEAMSL
jgi:hypothetical protein